MAFPLAAAVGGRQWGATALSIEAKLPQNGARRSPSQKTDKIPEADPIENQPFDS